MSLLVWVSGIYIQKHAFGKEDLPQLAIHPGLPGLLGNFWGQSKIHCQRLVEGVGFVHRNEYLFLGEAGEAS
jgi:hypothetical protein